MTRPNTYAAPRNPRETKWFMLDSALYDEQLVPGSGDSITFAAALGTTTTSVYLFLASKADSNQKCNPSLRLISKGVGVSETAAKKSILRLAGHSLISIENKCDGTGRRASNSYTLLSPSNWTIKENSDG